MGTPLLARLAWHFGPAQSHVRFGGSQAIASLVTCGLGADPFAIHYFMPQGQPIVGAMVVVPGLHPLGPDDVRLRTLCLRLASAGILVAAPGLTDYLAIHVAPRAVDQLHATVNALALHPLRPKHVLPGIFSISFGSYPTLALRARGVSVGSTLLFGGFHHFSDVMTAIVNNQGDPLNRPAACIHTVRHLSDNPAPLLQGWRLFCLRSWGDNAMQERTAYTALAEQIASDIAWRDGQERHLFLMGCNVLPDDGRIQQAAELAAADFGFLEEMHRGLKMGASKIAIAHGHDDQVISVEHAHKLNAALPTALNGGLFITRSYGHTGTSTLNRLLEWPREITTMVGMLRALSDAATTPEYLE